MENISKNISYNEGMHSNTAIAKGIDNTPNEEVLVRMRLVAEKVFQPVRDWYGKPINVNSFYRCPKLNYAVGGATRSQHLKGEAIDISAGSTEENRKIFNWIKDNLTYDQLIWEYGGKWIHLSYKEGNRNMVFNIN
jgi:hypothetical protein